MKSASLLGLHNESVMTKIIEKVNESAGDIVI